ncbi:MAG: 7-cyano-7-deazaguanine synthase QueC [Phycisphaeraceae bacterium]|nr:7-cyano-7-deazaguanine synthase QueC [Phycisphaeraceae bacterium]MBX3405340.1 7-cyano-7-deazaguanine synthase QueC [Phycisphaeraceae bacterium]
MLTRHAQQVVVLVSGGLDSAVTLAAACAEFGAARVGAITFDYGQRHRVELGAAARVASAAGIDPSRHVTLRMDLRSIGGSALTADIDVPKDRPGVLGAGGHEVPITYVPARNLIFLSCAAALAETIGADRIDIGANAVDYSGYPDCREPFLRAFEAAANAGTKAGAEDGRTLRVHAPLLHLSKVEIIRLGARLGVDFVLTTSCYDPRVEGGRAQACGHCDSCVIRARAFAAAGVADPTEYQPGVRPWIDAGAGGFAGGSRGA